LSGYEVKESGNIILPVIGEFEIEGLTLEKARVILQQRVNEVFNNTTVECKLLNFKFTVIGEVRSPGTYLNYGSYLTVLEAIGRAGGIEDFGKRNNILVIRPVKGGTKTFKLNLQDKQILSSEAYFLLPNDVIIIEPEKQKIFNANLPTISFIITTVASVLTTSLLLINYLNN
jgi:polysaccharide export outer membrane protein